MFVPSDLTFTSSKAEQEFGQALSQCEMQLVQAGLQDKVPLFRVFFKIVAEYEKGEEVSVNCNTLSALYLILDTHDHLSIYSLHGTPG